MAVEVKILTTPEGFQARARTGSGGNWHELLVKLLEARKRNPRAGVPVPVDGSPTAQGPIDPETNEAGDNDFYARAKSVRGILSKTAKDMSCAVSATIYLDGIAGKVKIPGLSGNGVYVHDISELSPAEMKKRYGVRKSKKSKAGQAQASE